MARSLGELFPVIVAVLGVYFLVCAMGASSVVTTTTKLLPGEAEKFELSILNHRSVNAETPVATTATVLVGTSNAPGLYAIASAVCFGSVLLWSRLSPPTPAPKQD
ncbi:MAG: hypothetical protein AAFY08_03745 [Planctomycetota bacterium]